MEPAGPTSKQKPLWVWSWRRAASRCLPLAPIIIVTLGAFLVRAWRLGRPQHMVFDEVFFVPAATDLLLAARNPDPEPPLAKLLIVLGVQLFGYHPVGWRAANCLFGTLLVPIAYLFGLRLFGRPRPALLLAAFIAIDGMFIVESRIAVIDIFFCTFNMLAYACFLNVLWGAQVAQQRAWLFVTGVVLGLGVAAKWFALAAWGLITLVFFTSHVVEGSRTSALDGWILARGDLQCPPNRSLSLARSLGIPYAISSLVLVPSLVYTATFIPHLVADAEYFVAEFVNFHARTFQFHALVGEVHRLSSPWCTWPLLLKPVVYVRASVPQSNDLYMISLIGNPALWWNGLVTWFIVAAEALRKRSPVPLFISLAFAFHYAPFILIPRYMFSYHMLGSLPFMFAALAYALDRYLQERVSRWWAYGILVAAVALSVYFYPVWVAMPLSEAALRARLWLPGW